MPSLVADRVAAVGGTLAASVRELAATDAALAALADRWRALEARADASFFTSWGWIGSWLAVLPPARARFVVEVADADRAVALAILVPGRRRLLRFLPRPIVRLNDSTEVGERGPTIEHNGLLAMRGREADPAVWAAAWEAVRRRGIVELSIPYIARARLAVPDGAILQCTGSDAAPFIDFAKLDRGERIAERLMSRNGREQLRRAQKAYQAIGPLSVRRARSIEEAFTFLARLEALHQATWVERGKPGSFADPFFVAFHRRLIETRFASGEIELLAVTAGEVEVGYLYNFRYRDRIYAYQSGFRYQEDPRLKPGLVCHEAAITRAAADPAIRFYDFLAGDSRFKRGFANGAEILDAIVLVRDDPLIRLENTMKNWLKYSRQGHEPGNAGGAE